MYLRGLGVDNQQLCVLIHVIHSVLCVGQEVTKTAALVHAHKYSDRNNKDTD